MTYCHDCGANNDAGGDRCRICGHPLAHELSGVRCPGCGTVLATDAGFCSGCGSPILVGAMAAVGAAAGSAEGRFDSSPSATASALGLGDGLDLPDWLKRAAAERPHDPSAALDQAAVFSTVPGLRADRGPEMAARPAAEEPARGLLADDPASGTASADEVVPAPVDRAPDAPLPPLPTGDLGAAMPGWLKPPPSAPPPATESPAADLTDTTSFISENDLPEWIRQLAASEEARRLEEARQAQIDQTAADGPSDDGDGAAPSSGRRSRRLPGEIGAAPPAGSPWLSRRERGAEPATEPAGAWSEALATASAAFASVVGKDEPQPAPTEAVGPAPTPTLPPAAAASERRVTAPTPLLRKVLLAAVLLALAALIAYLVAAGGVG